MLATLVFVLVALSRLSSTNSFQNAKLMQNSLKHPAQFGQLSRFGNANALKMSEEEGQGGFTRRQILKEETEAPFRKIRYFLYLSLSLSAALATLITGTSILAVNGGVREGNLPELYQNLGINLAGLPVIAYFWRRDIVSQQSLLQRIEKGGSLARLKLKIEEEFSGDEQVVKLSDLRRDRGIEKRVIIVAAPRELLKESLRSTASMFAALVQSDVMIVPLAISTSAPGSEKDGYTLTSISMDSLFESTAAEGTDDEDEAQPPPITSYIGMPVQMQSWNSVIKGEFRTALEQNPDALEKGITLIIKKNGKVGSRRFGVPIWESITDDIQQRTAAGLDVTNI